MVFIGFLVCTIVIFFHGKRLSFYGDLIAALTGLSRGWIGLVLMASVTSLPELFAGVSAAGIVESPDLAVGDVVGSCAFNMAILSLLDWASHHPLSQRISPSNILSGTLGIILFSLVGLGLFLPDEFIVIGWVGSLSIAFIFIYLISMHLLYQYTKKNGASAHSEPEPNAPTGYTLKKVISLYILHALMVILAAIFLPFFAEGVAARLNLSQSFVGTLFLAGSTSLPEVAVSLSAVRLGSVDLAVGNLFGSNLFNILILAIDDLVYTRGNLLKDASENNIISVFSIIIMTAVAISGILFKPQKKSLLLTWDTLLILVIYTANVILLYYINHT